MKRNVSFVAHGVAAPKGSKNQFGGESSKRVKPWMDDVAYAAGQAMTGEAPLSGPLLVSAIFVFTRPKKHFVANNPERGLRDDAPHYVTTRPDVDKLQRAIGDALTGIVYLDDDQIAQWSAMKIYGDSARAIIGVRELEPQGELTLEAA